MGDFTQAERNKMLLSNETRLGLEITGAFLVYAMAMHASCTHAHAHIIIVKSLLK